MTERRRRSTVTEYLQSNSENEVLYWRNFEWRVKRTLNSLPYTQILGLKINQVSFRGIQIKDVQIALDNMKGYRQKWNEEHTVTFGGNFIRYHGDGFLEIGLLVTLPLEECILGFEVAHQWISGIATLVEEEKKISKATYKNCAFNGKELTLELKECVARDTLAILRLANYLHALCLQNKIKLWQIQGPEFQDITSKKDLKDVPQFFSEYQITVITELIYWHLDFIWKPEVLMLLVAQPQERATIEERANIFLQGMRESPRVRSFNLKIMRRIPPPGVEEEHVVAPLEMMPRFHELISPLWMFSLHYALKKRREQIRELQENYGINWSMSIWTYYNMVQNALSGPPHIGLLLGLGKTQLLKKYTQLDAQHFSFPRFQYFSTPFVSLANLANAKEGIRVMMVRPTEHTCALVIKLNEQTLATSRNLPFNRVIDHWVHPFSVQGPIMDEKILEIRERNYTLEYQSAATLLRLQFHARKNVMKNIPLPVHLKEKHFSFC